MTPDERFSFHDLKRKDVTDTPGTRVQISSTTQKE